MNGERVIEKTGPGFSKICSTRAGLVNKFEWDSLPTKLALLLLLDNFSKLQRAADVLLAIPAVAQCCLKRASIVREPQPVASELVRHPQALGDAAQSPILQATGPRRCFPEVLFFPIATISGRA